jgi:RHS repeat-associated protein
MSSTQPTLLCHYRYDPLDRLINQNQPDQPAQQRFYCKSRRATFIGGAIHLSIVPLGDLWGAHRARQGDVVDTTLLATDLQRSVLQTLKANNEGRAIAYSPYGYLSAENGLLSLLGFNGEYRDLVTERYLLGNGYRAFNSVLMRFNSPDSWSPFGKGGLNPYMYCSGDPVNFSDESGHILWKRFRASLLKLFKSRSPIKATRLNYDQRSDVLRELRYGHRINIVPMRRRLSDPGPKTASFVEPDFVGLHGTTENSVINLRRKGVIPKESKQNEDPGFYFSPNIKTANYHSADQQFKVGLPRETPHVVEVHIQGFTRMTPGKDYDFRRWGDDRMELIAKNHISRSIIIRKLGSTPKTRMVSPRSLEAPF